MNTLTSRQTYWILGVILVVALALRLYRLDTYSIYFDEKATLFVSQGVAMEGANQKDVFTKKYFTPADFWRPKTLHDHMEANARSDIGNSPAYYAMLWAWLKVFGLSDASLRMPSVIFSMLLVGLVFVFVRRHFGFLGESSANALALLSAGIAAIEPFFVAYSHIARNYSMTFFLTLLATHLFLLLMERIGIIGHAPNANKANAPLGLYAAYGLVFVLAVLSHFLAITVFLCHGLFAVLYLRKPKAWLAFGITAAIGLGLISLWFLSPGGKYTFFTLDYQAKLYRSIALKNAGAPSPYGLILPATLPNIVVRALPIFSDLFMPTNGLGEVLRGIRNSALALGLGGLATAVLYVYGRIAKPPVWVYGAVPLLLLAGLPFYTVVPLRLLVLSGAVPVVYLIGQYLATHFVGRYARLVVLLLLLAVVPTLFLLFMAWRAGHTFGITQRYSGFSFPYVCMLVAIGWRQLTRQYVWFAVPLLAVQVLQGIHIVKLLRAIYADQAPKYTYFDRPRIANPYWRAAQQIKAQYQPGDTILYPNRKRIIESETMDRTYTPLTLLDAQTINLYLPPTATYWQRIDPNEPDRVVLVKRNGDRIVIVNFEGLTYRYGDS